VTENEIEKAILEYFQDNYERLKLESGHWLAEDTKQNALQQVLLYYKKMKDVAEKVTETEVKLTLPEQRTPKGLKYTIEGVVDIVKEAEETWMYDIKTHDPEYVKANIELYEEQLNVYAYIWNKLRGNPLDHTAVISTAHPRELKQAVDSGDKDQIEEEMKKWEPLIQIDMNKEKVANTIENFGKIVDEIENCCFGPPSVDKLKEAFPGTKSTFARRICPNCDARFSCSSYIEFARTTGGKYVGEYKKYFETFNDDDERENWVNANLDVEKIDNSMSMEGEE